MQPPDELKQIELLCPDHKTAQAELLLWDSGTKTPEHIRLALRFGDREIVSEKETYWEALSALRAELELENILIRCYGGSRNVYPSGMCLSMGTGDLAYRTQMGQTARTADLVSIFDSGPDVESATLAEQRDFHDQWLSHFTQVSKPL